MSSVLALALGLVLGGAIAALAYLRFELSPAASAVLGGCVTLAVLVLATRGRRRRARLRVAPISEAYRAILEEEVAFYRGLDAAERRRFEGEVQVFLAEQTITGPRAAPLDDELRVLVAASAVVVAFGHREHHYPRLRDIVVYDQAFDEDYQVGGGGNVLGMVHAQGPILFSARSLRQGFRGAADAHNVGFHEFAHVLDFESGRADGVPGFMPWGAVEPWLEVIRRETTKVERRRSVLRRYAATNEAEFFAVATEAFFEQPVRLREKHPELYALLVAAYGQDPAARAER